MKRLRNPTNEGKAYATKREKDRREEKDAGSTDADRAKTGRRDGDESRPSRHRPERGEQAGGAAEGGSRSCWRSCADRTTEIGGSRQGRDRFSVRQTCHAEPGKGKRR